MPRRAPYTRVEMSNQVRPTHVRGMGDVVFKGFQCLNSHCRHFIFVRKDQIGPDYRIPCESCGSVLQAEGETKFFDYSLVYTNDGRVIESGAFVILHDDYVREAMEFKYCLLCNALKPISFFDSHGARESGRQGECRLCKTIYNGIKNQSRITDQHREAAQRRRLYKLLSGESSKIDSRAVFDRFGGQCFNCGKVLPYESKAFGLDHTLPAKYLWPITTANATLLCPLCNNKKHDLWPSAFYKPPQLKRLSRLTGIEYRILAGPALLNDAAVEEILKDVDAFIEEWIRYPDDIRKVRRLILEKQGVDIFDAATVVPPFLAN